MLFEDVLFDEEVAVVLVFGGAFFGELFVFIARSPGMPRRPVKAMLCGLRMFDVPIISYWIRDARVRAGYLCVLCRPLVMVMPCGPAWLGKQKLKSHSR